MTDWEILEDEIEGSVIEIIKEGNLVSEAKPGLSRSKDVYRTEDEVAKVFSRVCTDQIRRYGTFLPYSLFPRTTVSTEDLSELERYRGNHTVVRQEAFDETIKTRNSRHEDNRVLGDLVRLLDQIVEEDAVMADPVMENFNYFDGELKVTDYWDVESAISFPQSFQRQNAEQEYREEVVAMYEDAISSSSYELGIELETAARLFEDTSSHIRKAYVADKPILGDYPEVDVWTDTNRF